MVAKTNTTPLKEAQKDPKKDKDSVLDEHVRIDEKETKKVRTMGWWIFDGVVHLGINGIGNIAASIFMAIDKTNFEISQKIADPNDPMQAGLKRNGQPKEYKVVFGGKLPGFMTGFMTKNNPNYEEGQRLNIYEASNAFKNILKHGKNLPDSEKKGGLAWVSKKVPILKSPMDRLGDYAGDVLFLSIGGHVTNLLMWAFETKAVKPKLIRFLDSHVADPIMSFFGKAPTKEDLEERKRIYEKLDNDMSGKSFKGVWGARFAGIGAAIVTFTGLDLIDRGISNLTHGDRQTQSDLRGILRPSRLVLKSKGYSVSGVPENPASADEYFNIKFYILSSTEVLGTLTTTAMQYVYLMARELIGIGPKTNIKNNKDKESDSRETQTSNRPAGVKINGKTVETRSKDDAQTTMTAEEFTREQKFASPREILDRIEKKNPSAEEKAPKEKKSRSESIPKTDRYEKAVGKDGHLARNQEALEGVTA